MQRAKSLKIFTNILFAIIVLGAFFLSIFFPEKWVLEYGYILPYLSLGCVGVCFLLSLIFIKKDRRKIYIILALLLAAVADVFLTLDLKIEHSQLIGLSIFCGAQLFYMLYTMALSKSIGMKVVNLAVRVTLCLVAYFVMANYYALTVIEIIAMMYIINAFVTLLFLLFKIKTQWLIFFGFLLFFLCDIVVGLKSGACVLFNLSGPFVDFLFKYDIAYYLYIPSQLLIATASVWFKSEDY